MHCVGSFRQTGALQKCPSGQYALKWLSTMTTPPSSPAYGGPRNPIFSSWFLFAWQGHCILQLGGFTILIGIPRNKDILMSFQWCDVMFFKRLLYLFGSFAKAHSLNFDQLRIGTNGEATKVQMAYRSWEKKQFSRLNGLVWGKIYRKP